MKKQIIRLTESDLHEIIKESVNRILHESYSHSEEYIMVDVNDVNFEDERVSDFLYDNQDKELPEVSVKIEFEIEPYDPGDYWTPPYGGYARIVDCTPDEDGYYKKIIPEELYQCFIDGVGKYVDDNHEEYEISFYEDYNSYEPDYDRYHDDDYYRD